MNRFILLLGLIPAFNCFAEVPETTDVTAYPAGLLDQRYEIASGQPATVVFAFRNDTGRKDAGTRLKLKLLEGFRFLDTHRDARVVKNSGGDLEIDWHTPSTPGVWDTWYTLPLLIQTDLPPGSGRHRLKYAVTDTRTSGPEHVLFLEIIPPVLGKKPIFFLTGCMFSHDSNLTEKGAETFAVS